MKDQLPVPMTNPIRPSFLPLNSNRLLVAVAGQEGVVNFVETDAKESSGLKIDLQDPINDQLIVPAQTPIHLLATKTGIQVYRIVVQ